ncbi:MAG: hypothetical protein AAFX03_09770 [Pseudomonadota bacterium]
MLDMSLVRPVIAEAYAFAARAARPTLQPLLVFAAVTALAAAFPRIGLGGLWIVPAFLAIFAAGCAYSAALYRQTFPGTAPLRKLTAALMRANAAVYLAFFFIGFFVVFGLSILAGVFLSDATGLDQEAAQADPDAIRRALGEMAWTPYGFALWTACAAGAGALAFLALRLFLFGAATAAAGEAKVFETWPRTRGRALTLALIAAATHVAPFAVAMGLAWGASAIAEGLSAPIVAPAAAGFVSVLAGAVFLLPGHGAAAALHRRLME